MGAWVSAMPPGMHLKSEGFASTLFEPSGRFTLGAYCAEAGIPYADTGVPVKKDTFVAYGQEFQRRFVPNLEDRTAVSVTRDKRGFTTVFSDGGSITSRRIVVAAGVSSYAEIPENLRGLPSSICSHSAHHGDFTPFADRDVVVIGGGSSAMDVAAALRRNGARVTVVARRGSVRFQTPLGTRTLRDKIRAPMTTLGPGWKSVLCTKAPLLFHLMPADFRTTVVKRYLGPAPAWFVRDQIEGHVPILTGTVVTSAEPEGGRARLGLRSADGTESTIFADHVICATGFRVSVNRDSFLASDLVSAIKNVEGAPKLSRHFESSLAGLYFIGPAAANSFGPMLRFAAGAGFTARRVSRHLSTTSPRRSVRQIEDKHAAAVTADA